MRTYALNAELTVTDVEIAVAQMFGYRQNVIVPNVSWGLGLRYEADLLVLRPSGWLIEVEIKLTRQDLLADRNKSKWILTLGGENALRSTLIKLHYFALPREIVADVWRPESGIIEVHGGYAKIVRAAHTNPLAQRLSADRQRKLLELAAMRTWTLKDVLNRVWCANRNLRDQIAATRKGWQ